MTASIKVIFDGFVLSEAITVTDFFSNSSFLFIQTPDLTDVNEGYEIAGSVKVFIENFVREIPIIFEVGIIDTNVIIPLPSEVANTNLPLQLQLLATEQIRLIISAVKSNVSNLDLSEQITNGIVVDTVRNVIRGLDNLNGIDLPDLPESADTIEEITKFYGI